MRIVLVGCLGLLAACTSASPDAGREGASEVPVDVATSDGSGAPIAESVDSDEVTSTTALEVDEQSQVEHLEVRTRADGLVGEGVEPQDVGTVTARVTSASGEVCDVCLWLASEPAQRSTGLMGVTNLGEPVGMAFVWTEPTSGSFFMLGTPTPLSIAWFAPDGEFLAEEDMDPCLADNASSCERYGPGSDYDVAIEMFSGELGVIGIGPGSSIELLSGTESPACL